MAIVVEMQNTGDPELQRDVVARIEHVLSDSIGDWHILIGGSQGMSSWELKVLGPLGFERSYTLERSAGEHSASVIAAIVFKIVPRS